MQINLARFHHRSSARAKIRVRVGVYLVIFLQKGLAICTKYQIANKTMESSHLEEVGRGRGGNEEIGVGGDG